MYKLKKFLKRILPKSLIQFYHWFIAHLASIVYLNPSSKMVIIGVTGTNGKSSVTEMIAKVLEGAGKKVGFTSTVKFKILDKEWLNTTKMTMTGRFYLQRILRKMYKAGVEYVVIETSSQGIEQYRHIAINYDIVVFTNLTPEHIEAHGGFENYKKAKGKLFEHLTRKKTKTLFAKTWEKTMIVNLADQYADYFLSFPAKEKWGYFLDKAYKEEYKKLVNKVVFSDNYHFDFTGAHFNVDANAYTINLLGKFNIENALAVIALAKSIGIEDKDIKAPLASIKTVPGRMELINEGQNFTVLIDYAPEPASFQKLYETVELLKHNKIIHVFGSCGGGRDKARRPILGNIAGEKADYCIITNEDPYDDDPMEIIEEVAQGCLEKGKVENINLFKILNRKEAIKKAFNLANDGDIVLLTGKGAEQAIMLANGEKQKWDEREIARELLRKLNN